MSNLFAPDKICTKLVGVTMDQKNKEGRPYRQIFLQCMGEKDIRSLRLVREPENPYDTNAIAVYGDWGEGNYKLGYVQNRNRICMSCSTEYQKVEAGVELCEKCGGTLAREGLASMLAKFMDQGLEYKARVLQYTGGENNKSMGMNFTIERIM